MNITPWELERANAAAEAALRASSIHKRLVETMSIPAHIIESMHKRDIEQLGYTKVFLTLSAPSQPRGGTSSPSGIVGQGGKP